MMRNRSKLILATIILTALLSMPVFAECPGHHGKGDKGSESMPELTADQVKQINDLKMKLIRDTDPLKTEFQIKHMELQALWKEDNPDAKKILAKVKEISALKASLQEKMINHKIAVYKILTPEQRKMMKGMMGMHGMGCYGGSGCGMDGGGCCGGSGMGAGMSGGSGCHGAGR